nr:hypothetical protein [Tanacetum cinerariifolium]
MGKGAGFLWERLGRGHGSNGNGGEVERSGEEAVAGLAGEKWCEQCWCKHRGKTSINRSLPDGIICKASYLKKGEYILWTMKIE